MQRTWIFRMGCFFAVLLAPATAWAQNSDSQAGTTTAEIVNNPITLSELANLDFGTLLPTADDGTVRIRALDGLVINSNVFVRTPGNPGRWNVAGEADAFFTIQLPANGAVTLSNGTDNMAVNNFEHNAGNFPRLDSTGSLDFDVGATVSVRSNQTPGTYSALYTVQVAYD